MKEEIMIIYQHYVPTELIEVFAPIRNELQIEITHKKQEIHFDNFNGSEISDIVIYIRQHSTEILVGNFLSAMAYDILLAGLKSLWVNLSKLAIKKIAGSGTKTIKSKKISINLMNGDRVVEIVLEGDVNKSEAQAIIEKSFNFINSNKVDESFENPDFVSQKGSKKVITLIYNHEKELWEPENYGENKREFEKFVRDMENKLSN